MILKWSNLCSGAFVRNLVGLFVAFILCGTHVQGRRTETRAVIPRHRPYVVGDDADNFAVGPNSVRQWVDFINPRRQKLDDSSLGETSRRPPTTTEDASRRPSTTTHNASRRPPTTTDDASRRPPTSTDDASWDDTSQHPPITTDNASRRPPTTTDDVSRRPPITTDDAALDFASRRYDGVHSTTTAVTSDNPNIEQKTEILIKSEVLESGKNILTDNQNEAIHQDTVNISVKNRVGNESGNNNKSGANVTRESETSFTEADLNNRVGFTGRDGVATQPTSSSSSASYVTGGNFATPRRHFDLGTEITNTGQRLVVSLQRNGTISDFSIGQNDRTITTRGYDFNSGIIGREVHVSFTNYSSSGHFRNGATIGTGRGGNVLKVGSMMRRLGRQASVQEEGSEHLPACKRFIEEVPGRREFWSPNGPDNYPNNTDCIKTLSADPGHVLRLDFRDSFHIEPSEGCAFDYLEVRDGAHGYADVIGKYCGKQFPNELTSTGRHLWLRFKSDENIEYSGFHAVYEQRQRETTDGDEHEISECLMLRNGSEGFLRTSDIDPEYRRKYANSSVPLECMWSIKVRPGWKIQLTFPTFSLAIPNDCVSNFVDVFGNRTDMESHKHRFCGSIAELVNSETNVLSVRFLMKAKAFNSTFEALYTAYREVKDANKVSTPCHPVLEFDCQDETCIAPELKCNNNINCRFRWDEDECSKTETRFQKIMANDEIVIILVVFSMIMFGMCFAFVFNCVRKLMHDHKIIRENFRASREGRLDELGIKLPTSPRGVSRTRSPSDASSRDIETQSHHRHHMSVDSESRDLPPPRQECYVPGAGDLMPILVGASRHPSVPANGDAVFMRDASDEPSDEDMEMSNYPLPEMRDNECQTRESLFNTAERSVTPPPPPPPPPVPRQIRHNRPPIGQFSTFGYNRDNRREDPPPPMHMVKDYSTLPPQPPPSYQDPRLAAKDSQRFRAEAVIEMDAAGTRPFSVDSTKSAPDVIVTH